MKLGNESDIVGWFSAWCICSIIIIWYDDPGWLIYAHDWIPDTNVFLNAPIDVFSSLYHSKQSFRNTCCHGCVALEENLDGRTLNRGLYSPTPSKDVAVPRAEASFCSEQRFVGACVHNVSNKMIQTQLPCTTSQRFWLCPRNCRAPQRAPSANVAEACEKW